MENWRDLILRGDAAEAARRAGCTTTVYNQSRKLLPANWTPAMIKLNRELKAIVGEREKLRLEFQEEWAC